MSGRDGIELYQDLQAALRRAEACVGQLRESGEEKARAESDYREGLAKAELRLRADGHPAVLVRDLARGEREVARLYVKWQCAESLYSATYEELQLRKREFDRLRDEARESEREAGWR